MAPSDASNRSRGIALALATVVGIFGGHRFYVGKIGTGLVQLCTFGGLGIWWLYDWIVIAAGAFRDADGKRLINWAEYGGEDSGQLMEERMGMLLEEVDILRSEMGEVVERVDFMERVIARGKDRDAIPPASPPI